MKLYKRIHYNSPIILSFALISLVTLGIGYLTAGYSNRLFFSVYRNTPFDILTYVRLIGHVFGHFDYEHFSANMMLLLLLGPGLEEKYGSKRILIMILLTAIITGMVHCIISPAALLGASGVVFMMIILSSMTSIENGRIPITLIIIVIIYLGNEIIAGIGNSDNISQLAHIVGGGCGALFGNIFPTKSR